MLQRCNRCCTIAVLLGALFLISGPVLADDNRVKIPAPPMPPLPKIVLPSPPPMVWLPVPKVYVAHDTPHQIFHHEGHYYLRHQDVWYIGPGYNGPWAMAKEKQVPPGLRRYRGEHWGEYQREAAHHFREGRDDGHASFYAGHGENHPRERAHWKDKDHDRGRHAEKERNENRGNEDRGHGRGRNHD